MVWDWNVCVDESASLLIKTAENNSEILDSLQDLCDMEDAKCALVRTDTMVTMREGIIGIVHILLSCFDILTSVIYIKLV